MSGVSTGRGERSGDLIESVGFICLTCFCVAAGISLAVIAAGPSARHSPFEIEDTINPNDASPASLARLPRIGPARAREIVSYRSRFSQGNGRRPAFGRAEDLAAVTGVGPATIEAIRPWLSFDSRASKEWDIANQQP